jgi:phosphohistidine phosphatase
VSHVNVFIMRHGEAEAGADSDAKRELTQQGRDDITQMAMAYEAALSQVDTIWASPYIRAQQTAQLLSQHLSTSSSAQLPTPIITQPFLPPSGNPSDTLAALDIHRNETILIVSHQPLIGILVDGLAGLEPGRYRMSTGALACVTTEVYAKGCGHLEWLHQPASIQPEYS